MEASQWLNGRSLNGSVAKDWLSTSWLLGNNRLYDTHDLSWKKFKKMTMTIIKSTSESRHLQGRNHWGDGAGPLKIFIDPQFWTERLTWGSVALQIEMFYMFFLKSRLFQDFHFNFTPNWTMWSSKFQKISVEGLSELHPQTPPLALSLASPSIRASTSNLGCFGPSIRAPLDSDPQLLKRGCAIGRLYTLMMYEYDALKNAICSQQNKRNEI